MERNKLNILYSLINTLFLLLIISGISSCSEPVTEWEVESEYLVMTEYVEQNDFSEFEKMLNHTKLYRLLNTRGPFTLFLPSDEAIQKMYENDGVNSFTDYEDTSFVYNFIYNHLIGSQILSAEIGLGALSETNVLGDYIVSDFKDSQIRLNKTATIIDRDVEVSNGIIHIVDQVIPFVTMNIFEQLKALPDYSLFTEGLERTGIDDTLSIVEFPFSATLTARNRFTVLAVADTTFNRYGINTIDDLIAYFTDDPDNITSSDNEFYQYMDYHCLKETYFLSDLKTGTYPIMSQDNNVLMTITDDYKINPDKSFPDIYTGFNVEESNYGTKNGALHTINDLLPALAPEPISFTWLMIDHLEIISGEWFTDRYMTGESFHKWEDGENSFQNIKFEGNYMQYYFKESNWTSKDPYKGALNMIGYWWIEVTSPKIMKGKYEITTRIPGGSLDVYLDGQKVITTDGNNNLGTHVFDETESHTIKLVARQPLTLFWSYTIFTPVK